MRTIIFILAVHAAFAIAEPYIDVEGIATVLAVALSVAGQLAFRRRDVITT